MLRNILNDLAEDIQVDSSAYEGKRIANAEDKIIRYFLDQIDGSTIAVLHAALISRLKELEL